MTPCHIDRISQQHTGISEIKKETWPQAQPRDCASLIWYLNKGAARCTNSQNLSKPAKSCACVQAGQFWKMCSNFSAGSKSVPFPKKCYKDPKRTHLSVPLDGLGYYIYIYHIMYIYIQYIYVHMYTHIQTYARTYIHTYIHTASQAGRQAGRHAYIHTYIHVVDLKPL